MDLNMNYGGNHNGNQNVIRTSSTSVSVCEHPEHNPPFMVNPVLHSASSAPVWRKSFSHRCPACGYSFTFAVGRPAQT